ncbi:MAG: hypothetical protein F4X98_16895 [Gammaproteobacteria bacterium]|nr:hypothetical protein [Gammaproteobacteria bacterium]
MRAALAPLVGLIGLLGATMVSANTLDAVVATQVPGLMDAAGAPTIASETLSAGEMNAMVTEGHYHVTTSSSTPTGTTRANTGKPDTWLELRTEVDILLSDRGDSEYYYVRYDLDGMVLTGALPKPEVRLPFFPLCSVVSGQGTCGPTGSDPATTATTTAYRYMVPSAEIEVAYRGRQGDSEVIFRLPRPSQSNETYNHPTITGESQTNNPNGDYAVGTTITLLLPHHLAVMAAREATYGATVKVFEDLSEARESQADRHGAEVYTASGDVIKLAPAVGAAEVDAMLAIAEVSTPEEYGGAFRLFVDAGEDGELDMFANLAMVSVEVNKSLKHANNNLMNVTDAVLTGVSATVTSDAGNFGFGATFKLTGAGCTGSGLALMKPGDDGPVAIEEGESGLATSGTGMVSTKDSYFCVMVGGHNPDGDPPVHRQAIPEVGDPDMKDGYMLAATPTIADGAPDAVKPPEGTAMAAGSIDRNGTTVHVTYLSGSDNANQRLVIVNRGGDAARFWMNDFQSEGNQMVTHSGGMMLAQGSMSEVPGGGRVVVRIQDNLAFSERPPRAAGTLTVAGPTRNIDVMTVQVVGGTLDTTVYQHADM